MAFEHYRSFIRREHEPVARYALWRNLVIVLKLSPEASLRLEWIIFYYTKANKEQALVCRHFGIHRNTLGKWLKRFDPNNLRSLETQSRRPKKVRIRVQSRIKDQRIIDLRKEYPWLGKEKIGYLYRTQFREPITPWYVQRVIETYRLYDRKRSKRRKHSKQAYLKKKITELRIMKPHTGFLLHFDSIVLQFQGLRRYIITGIDHHSRLAYAWMYERHTSLTAKDFLLKMRYLFEQTTEYVHTDNGSEFHKHFQSAVDGLGLSHYWSRPKTPKDNAILERFNRTLKDEFLRQGNRHTDPTVFNRNLTEWLVYYNSIRPHQSLNYLTPLAFAEQTMNLHTMWSSSTAY